jgi:hypothetical protein
MSRRAARTFYFLNRLAGCLALVKRNVRLPECDGIWIPIAKPDRAPHETAEILELTYPGLSEQRLLCVTLMSDFDAAEFERELERESEPDRAHVCGFLAGNGPSRRDASLARGEACERSSSSGSEHEPSE